MVVEYTVLEEMEQELNVFLHDVSEGIGRTIEIVEMIERGVDHANAGSYVIIVMDFLWTSVEGGEEGENRGLEGRGERGEGV